MLGWTWAQAAAGMFFLGGGLLMSHHIDIVCSYILSSLVLFTLFHFVRAGLVTSAGRLVGQAVREVKVANPRPDHYIQSSTEVGHCVQDFDTILAGVGGGV